MIEHLALYKPLDWQIEPWRDKSPVMLLTGSAGGGKSRLAAEKLHAFNLHYAGATTLMLRKAREYAAKSVVPFMAHTVMGPDPRVTMKKGDGWFEYQNGSIMYWGGMKDEGQRQAIRSMGQDGSLDMVWVEEANAFTEIDFQEIIARMRGRAASWTQIMLSTNPDTPTHWIKRSLMDGEQASVYYSGAQDNPYNPLQYRDMLGRLTGVLGKRLRDGLWIQAEGAVYETFSDEIHVVDWFKPPEDWRRIRAIDFGYVNPFVCQWWAIDGDGRMYLYREIYRSKRLVSEHAKEINRLSQGEHIEATVADHDAEDRATLRAAGILTAPADKQVKIGIQKVQERLKIQPDGKPRLFIMRGATVDIDNELLMARKPSSTLEEIPGYVWHKWQDGRSNKEEPVKEHDHGCDSARYSTMYVDKGTPRKARSYQG